MELETTREEIKKRCSKIIMKEHSSTETVERPPRSFQGVDDVECGDGLSLGVFGVRDRVSDDLARGLISKSQRGEAG